MASIPLPALGIRPPQQPDTADVVARAMQLKSMIGQQQLQQQQIQGATLENQIRQRQVQSQQTLMQLAPQFVTRNEKGIPNGYDYDGLMDAALKNNVDPVALKNVQDMRKAQLDAVSSELTNQGKTLDNLQKTHTEAFQHINSVRGIADPTQRQAAWQEALNWTQQQGSDISKMPQQAPDDQTLDAIEARMGLSAQALADAKARMGNQQAGEQLKRVQLENQNLATYGSATPTDQDKFVSDYIREKGLPNSAKNRMEARKAFKLMVPQFNFNIGNQLPPGMTPEALDQSAQIYATTGQLPRIYGKNGGAMQAQIIKRASELYPGQNFAANAATYQADKSSLTGIQRQRDAVVAFENTAGKNLDIFLSRAQKVVDSGSPWINRPLRTIAQGGLGSADLAAYNAARQVAINEIAKVTSNPGLSGQLSDSARHEVEAFNPQNATLAQTLEVAKVLKQDMENRRIAYDQQIAEIKGRLGGGNQNSQQQKQNSGGNDPLGIR